MDKEEIRQLEPKYTGNTRHLTEGEAHAIKNDPGYEGESDGDAELLENIPPVYLFGAFHNNRPN